MDDYLALEPLLKARIQAVVPQGTRVVSIAELGDWKSRAQLAPAVFVGYARDRLDSEAGGSNQAWLQEWWTVVGVRNARNMPGGDALRQQAGPLLATLMQALGGWSEDTTVYRKLRRQNPPQVQYYPGYAEFPQVWQTRVMVRGTQQRR